MVPKRGEMAWCLPGEQEDQIYNPLSLRWVCWHACNSSFRRQGRPSLEEAACLDIKVNPVGEQIPVVSLCLAHAHIHSHTRVPVCTRIDSLPGTYALYIHDKKRGGGGAKALPINLTSLQGLLPSFGNELPAAKISQANHYSDFHHQQIASLAFPLPPRKVGKWLLG